MVKKRSLNETQTLQETGVIIEAESAQVSDPVDENPSYANLVEVIQEIRKNQNIIGYIAKNDEKATVDLDDSAKIVDYAMLTSQAFEASETLSESFSLGNIQEVVVEGKDIKVLCVNLGQNKLSIFMEKNEDHANILETLLSQSEAVQSGPLS